MYIHLTQYQYPRFWLVNVISFISYCRLLFYSTEIQCLNIIAQQWCWFPAGLFKGLQMQQFECHLTDCRKTDTSIKHTTARRTQHSQHRNCWTQTVRIWFGRLSKSKYTDFTAVIYLFRRLSWRKVLAEKF